MKFEEKMRELISTRQPIVHVRSEMEKECLIEILNITENEDICLYTYDPLTFLGLHSVEMDAGNDIRKTKATIYDESYGMEVDVNSPPTLNDFMKSKRDKRVVIVFNDFQILSNTSPLYNRLVRVYAEKRMSERNVTFIIISNNFEAPKELEHLINVVDYDTPSFEDIESLLMAYAINNGSDLFESDKDVKAIASKLEGFNYNEIINMLNKSVSRYSKIDLKVLEEEKMQEITKSSMLNIKKTNKTLDDVGGNERFKDYIKEVELCMNDEAKELGLTPKGHLALGVAGSAKTFTAEALAASWNVPFIKLELNKVLSKFAGESEKNMAKALELIRGCAPCVCLIDEVEKVLGGK